MAIKTTHDLGTLIRLRRKQLRITQKELALACRTGLRFLIDLERGKPTCQVGKALEVLQALGLIIEAAPLAGRPKGEHR